MAVLSEKLLSLEFDNVPETEVSFRRVTASTRIVSLVSSGKYYSRRSSSQISAGGSEGALRCAGGGVLTANGVIGWEERKEGRKGRRCLNT